MILWSRLLTQMLLLDFFKLVATNQIESFVSAPDFDKSCWFDNKFSLGFDFPNLPYFIDGDIKLTQVIFDIIALAPFIVKRLKEKKDGENEFQTHAIMRYIARKHDLCGKVQFTELCREGKYDNMEILHRRRKSGRGWTCSQSRVWTSGIMRPM